ncbi:hypothetical protein CH92_10805 [Stutzerimonas stutzeri]|uniref:DUF2141 domain-containing protein n=1 Tax=Stutzerimonas stutzeri TaxID=316 RepID=W8RU63_STUST|nr:DUF2141 domain-containing protein [Stutzerimonas stutzeri]AHL75566.1 hypothetical protein CH92_10805 [Stutzerimonas stutzeri]MCQ4327858.1 DUF2141 domain-containing protein [Stutzerimonas stutzeri]
MTLRALFLLLAVSASGAAFADGQTLTVRLNDVKHDHGSVRIALFSDPKSFRKVDEAFATQEVPAAKGTVTLLFDGVPAGQYAIMAYHDENANGELDRRFGMFPTEGYGLSNNPKVMGPPAFEDSEFVVSGTAPTEVDISIRY